MSSDAWKERLELVTEKMVQIRRHLHRHPELSGEETETTRYIRERLEESGIRIASEYPLETGLIAEIGGYQDGPVIALRADIDALPIQAVCVRGAGENACLRA